MMFWKSIKCYKPFVRQSLLQRYISESELVSFPNVSGRIIKIKCLSIHYTRKMILISVTVLPNFSNFKYLVFQPRVIKKKNLIRDKKVKNILLKSRK